MKEYELSFLNPAVLYALAAAAIPLLIHLLNRRKTKRIPFSTVQFLKRLEKKQMRNLRIRQLLLLLLRTLVILLIVTAFARPTLRSGSEGLLSERSPIEAVIILDNSLSLNEVRLSGSLLEKLRQAFTSLQTVFQAGDRITVLQSTVPLEILAKQENFHANLWERVLQKLQANYLKSDLDNAMLSALEQLRQSVYVTREIYVISDFQRSALANGQLTEMLQKPGLANITIFTIPIVHENFENLSLDSVEVVNRLIEVNQPLQISTVLRNHHPEKYLNTLASIILNGNRVAQQNVNIAPGLLSEVQFQLTLTDNGFVEGQVEIESDALQEDNRRYFNFYVPEKIKILHIYPESGFESFIPLIIQPARERGIFDYSEEVMANWTNQNFMAYDMVVLEGVNQLPETLVLRLQNFIEQGGGALIIPGNQPLIPQYQNLFLHLKLGKLYELRGTPGQTTQFLTVQELQEGHPIFEGLFEENKSQLNPIEVYASYQLNPASGAEILIQLSDRSPLLLQSLVGKGTAFFLAMPLQREWSQLPVKGFVVPMIYRMIYFAGTRKVLDRQQVRTGKVFQEQFANLEAPFNFQLRGRKGIEIKLNPRFRGANVFLEVRETAIPGNYKILHNEQVLNILSVNPWKEESQAEFYQKDELAAVFPGSQYFANLNSIPQMVQNSRFGREFWKQFLVLALILLLLEMLLARTGAKKEYGESLEQEVVTKSQEKIF